MRLSRLMPFEWRALQSEYGFAGSQCDQVVTRSRHQMAPFLISSKSSTKTASQNSFLLSKSRLLIGRRFALLVCRLLNIFSYLFLKRLFVLLQEKSQAKIRLTQWFTVLKDITKLPLKDLRAQLRKVYHCKGTSSSMGRHCAFLCPSLCRRICTFVCLITLCLKDNTFKS